MKRKTKEELAEEREKRKAAKEEKQKLSEIEFERRLLLFSDKRIEYRERRRKYDLIVSDLVGWYDELDKLTKKSPADQVTDLQLETVNDIIDQVKQLVTDDEFIEKVKTFVAAGDNPQYRDVIGVLRRLKQGLNRFDSTISYEKKSLAQMAGEFFHDDIDILLRVDLKTKYKRSDFYQKDVYDKLS